MLGIVSEGDDADDASDRAAAMADVDDATEHEDADATASQYVESRALTDESPRDSGTHRMSRVAVVPPVAIRHTHTHTSAFALSLSLSLFMPQAFASGCVEALL
ncbi:hypothetical protein FI667_g16596, partial [Globisporangium splendens]